MPQSTWPWAAEEQLMCSIIGKPVSHAGYGLNIFGVYGVQLNLAAQVADVNPEAFPFVLIFGPPDLGQQHLVGEHSVCVEHQRLQQGELDRCELLHLFTAFDEPRCKIDLKTRSSESLRNLGDSHS